MSYAPSTSIRRSYRADVAHEHVVQISQFHRIQASPGYRQAAVYVAKQLAAAGVETQVNRYPAHTRVRFWSCPGFQEWSCEAATLHLLDNQGGATETLCDFADIATSVIQRSIPVNGEFEVVALAGKGGQEQSDYVDAQGNPIEVAGKLVLTREGVGPLLDLAVRQRGAAGLLFDGMRAGGRSEADLPDGRQYTSFWWAGEAAPDAWGFVLSPRQGEALRATLAAGQRVRVRARIDSRLYDGEFEVVEGVIPGRADSAEVVLIAHLCHPRPGAHDNASGAAALLEAAATLARLIAQGDLAAPARTIRFLWLPEMTGTYAWLSERAAALRQGRYLAGLNLDMVGADQSVTGSTWQLVGLPEAGAGFADHLLAWLREPFLSGTRHDETPFSAGSDHYIMADPSVGIPAPMLIQWPDKFYHTSEDTPDKVSPDSLARSGALAAVYAYWLATAGPAEAGWLGHWMAGRFATRAGRLAAAAAETLQSAAGTPEWAVSRRRYLDQNRFQAERMGSALASLARLGAAPVAVAGWQADVAATAAREEAWALAGAGAGEPGDAGTGAGWAGESSRWVPRRSQPGPVDMGLTLQAQTPAFRSEYWAFADQAGPAMHDAAALLQYWADGRRSVAEIDRLVELESGRALGELALRFFQLLAQAKLVELLPAGDGHPDE